MIGFVLRGLGFGVPGEGLCLGLIAGAVAICAFCGINRCMKMRMRDCGCIKKWMRATGTDKYDDFEMMVLVHRATMTTTTKSPSIVRVTAGQQTVETDPSKEGIFQANLSVFVEQGTQEVDVDLMDPSGRKVLASLKLDPLKDILQKGELHEVEMKMKQKSKGLHNPRITLTIIPASSSEVERGLISGMGVEANLQLKKIQHAQVEEQGESFLSEGGPGSNTAPLSDLDLLAKGCCGPLDMFGSWGRRDKVYVGVRGPLEGKRHYLGVWKDKAEFEQGVKGSLEIDLLKITSVQPDPGRTEVFVLNYLDSAKIKKRLTFRRLDRARDVWVEMFQLLIKMLHDQKDAARKKRIL
eukprot:CAMPEP_0179074414 /NCGR_PEP_ID=MMETSP0796-20121207/33073_1 /TAXON_ID=73915 /ORGANISM="Pyrodinium bahamense, Strain pbaha01" /LENGTH=352 /DNA_ID=CAMNT_0020771635 /DNA_START=61 /DNA_END=1119 /DNA_ORIENTATION=+